MASLTPQYSQSESAEVINDVTPKLKWCRENEIHAFNVKGDLCYACTLWKSTALGQFDFLPENYWRDFSICEAVSFIFLCEELVWRAEGRY